MRHWGKSSWEGTGERRSASQETCLGPIESSLAPRERSIANPLERAATLSAALFGQKESDMSITRHLRHVTSRHRLVGLLTGVAAASVLPFAAGAGANAQLVARFPVTITTSAGAVTFAHAPSRIISLSPTATQMLFAIGAGKDVIAADSDSTLPANAPRTALSGLVPNVEAIARYRPQVVIISYNPNGLALALHKLGIPTLELDAAKTLRDTYAQIAQLGALTGTTTRAQKVISSMRTTLVALVADTPRSAKHLSYYYELDQTYYSVTSATFIGQVMRLMGLRNIADAAPSAASGYPQLSSEYIVKENPALIVLADTICCGQSATTVAARPAWQNLRAVKDGGVVALNDSIASQWGPNIVTLVRDVEAGLRRVASHLGAA